MLFCTSLLVIALNWFPEVEWHDFKEYSSSQSDKKIKVLISSSLYAPFDSSVISAPIELISVLYLYHTSLSGVLEQEGIISFWSAYRSYTS